MTLLRFEGFKKKYNLKNDIMNESEIQRIPNFSTYPRDSKIYSDKGFVNIDNDLKVKLTGQLFMVKIINHTTLTHLLASLINSY